MTTMLTTAEILAPTMPPLVEASPVPQVEQGSQVELNWDADPELAMVYVALREAVLAGYSPSHDDVRATYTIARQMDLSTQVIRMLHLFAIDEIAVRNR